MGRGPACASWAEWVCSIGGAAGRQSGQVGPATWQMAPGSAALTPPTPRLGFCGSGPRPAQEVPSPYSLWAVVTSRLSWVRTCGQAPVVVGGIQGLLASGPRAAPSPCSGDLLASRRHGLECHVLGGDICHSFCLEESTGLSPPQGGVCRITGPSEGTHASVHSSGGVADSAGQMQMLDRVTRPDGRQGRKGSPGHQ